MTKTVSTPTGNLPAHDGPDWEAIEGDYRAGILSLRQIGVNHSVSHTAIGKRATKDGWTRDLSAKIRAAADAEVSKAVVSSKVATVSESRVVATNAALQAGIRLSHREDIAKARALTLALLLELQEQTGPDRLVLRQFAKAEVVVDGKELGKVARERIQTAIARAENLGNRASVAKALTEAMRVQIALERQAFGIEGGDAPDPDGGDFVKRMLNARNRAAHR